jgi:hypothetical protein
MSALRLGILGLSPGNGHPYSWSAIFNGYDPAHMAICPFPAIPAYLSRQHFPEDSIAEARVTHVWTQERELSSRIAAAAHIPNVVHDFREMIGAVDAILLARDDAETHFEMAVPFLDASLPIYIDKPLALTVAEAQRLLDRQQRPGQIFTGSALAYAAEFRPSPSALEALGPLRYVEGVTVKDWDRYAIHVIEPLLALLTKHGGIREMAAHGNAVRHLDLVWDSGLEGRITALGTPVGSIVLRLFGEHDWLEMVFKDSFTAFRTALRRFTDIVTGRSTPQKSAEVLDVIRIIEAGRSK